MKKYYIHKNTCRACFSNKLVKVFDLGKMPLANSFLKKSQLKKAELKVPLALYLCENCNLLQITDIVNPKVLFNSNYYYQTSTSRPLVEHFIEFGGQLVKRFINDKKELFIDIGGNDAALLNSIKKKCRVLNIDPSKNVAKMSAEKGVETIPEFFSAKLAKKIVKERGCAKVVTASNVFAHLDDLDDFLKGIEVLIGEDGVFVFEVHWAANLLGLAGTGGFDQIYHEHLTYYSLASAEKLISRFNLKIFDAKILPIHGKLMQVFVSKNKRQLSSVRSILKTEEKLGLNGKKVYADFAKDVDRNKEQLMRVLASHKNEGKKIFGFGAPGKSTTLMNYFKIDGKILDFIVDDSVIKQGTFTPGTHIPIFSRSILKKNKEDYCLILAWNYADSILAGNKKLKKQGMKFIIPLPVVKII